MPSPASPRALALPRLDPTSRLLTAQRGLNDWRTFSALALVDSVRQLTEAAIDAYAVLLSGVVPAAWMSEALFTTLYDRLIRRRGDPPATTYLLGYDSLPIRADKALFNLAAWARQQPALCDYLERTPASELAAGLARNRPPDDLPPALWEAWEEQFRAHLSRYGHMLYDLDFAHPVPADYPAPVLEALRLYLRGQGTDPTARQQEAARQREEATRATTQRLRGWRLRRFHTSLARAQRYAPLREDGLAAIGLAYPLIRQLLRELGGRMAQRGVIAAADNIFWLSEAEVRLVAGQLDAGQTLVPLVERVPLRRAEHAAMLRLSPPRLLPQRKLFGREVGSHQPRRRLSDQGVVITGVACSGGRVTATARVVRDPDDFSQVRPGDVLVASITTPAWTPLFALASAVVTDIGGPLSHGSIVAREYGIPAVLGTGDATRRIHSGDTVTVDGGTGTVVLAPPYLRHGS